DNWQAANKKLDIAKRIAADPQGQDKGFVLVQQAAEDLQEAQWCARAYKLMERLWSVCLERVHGAVAEEELCHKLTAHDLGALFKPKPQDPNRIEAGQLDAAVAVLLGRPPQYALDQPLPADAMKQLGQLMEEPNQVADILYNDLFYKCQEGTLFMSDAMHFEDDMNRERVALQKCAPGQSRLLRVVAFNRVVAFWCTNFAYQELMVHRRVARNAAAAAPTPEGSCILAQEAAQDTPALSRSSAEASSAGPPTPQESPDRLCESLLLSGLGEQDVRDSPTEDLPGVCVSCIERPAIHVIRECGHMVYCATCRRKVVARQLKNAGGRAKAKKPAELNNKELERTAVKCPVCREEGFLIKREKFTGILYEV
ncbi:unnamed protein product, partial [Polarella glacialis]